MGWAHAQRQQAFRANIDRLFPFKSKSPTHRAHSSHLEVGDAVGSRVGTALGVCDGDQLDGAGDGDGLGDCVHAGVLHAACSAVNGHGVPVPSGVVAMARWRLVSPPPPAHAFALGRHHRYRFNPCTRGSRRSRGGHIPTARAYILPCSCPTQSRRMPSGSYELVARVLHIAIPALGPFGKRAEPARLPVHSRTHSSARTHSQKRRTALW